VVVAAAAADDDDDFLILVYNSDMAHQHDQRDLRLTLNLRCRTILSAQNVQLPITVDGDPLPHSQLLPVP